jgi:hypothetical protein
MELMGESDIARKQAAPGDERPILDARQRMPEHPALVRPGRDGINALVTRHVTALRICAAAARTALMMFW